MKHLVLVGLPGAGKTTLGRAVAARAGVGFLDFDEEIQRRSGLSPSAFFERYGEPAFRAQELALSRELVGRHTIVVAPGGGWIAQEAAREALRPYAHLVYLRVSPAAAAQRLGVAAQDRPLLAGDPTARLQHLLAVREQWYTLADTVVDTEHIGIEQLTNDLLSLVQRLMTEAG